MTDRISKLYQQIDRQIHSYLLYRKKGYKFTAENHLLQLDALTGELAKLTHFHDDCKIT